ncbi:MAG: ABC transporter ATP-binding protein [Austwickia sp.]|nr:ABC transporter ATP-binding protein [Austwickia sp.]
MPGEAVLSVSGLSVTVGDRALVSGVDLQVARGERVGLIGESGSGKTLTALAVMGLLPENLQARGSVRLAGADRDLVGAGERALSRLRGSAMAMVFQEPMTALNPTMRVGDQVAEVMLIHGTRPDRRTARAAARELLADVRLPDPEQALRAYPHQLSGGQRQRVVLAMALANDPALLICDEPTTALDVTVQANVLDLIVSGVAARDAGLLFITHDLAVVATVCEKVAVMVDGRVVESGPVQQVFTAPTHEYTRQLLAASDLSVVDDRGRLRSHRADAATRVRTQDAGADRSVARERVDLPAIEVDQVSRVYRRARTSLLAPSAAVQALSGVSLRVAHGEKVGIVGESGCGKSTLLRIIAGLDQPTSGTVRVEGQIVSGLPERRLGFLRDRLQLVFQDPMGSLDPRMRVADSVAEPLVAQRKPAGPGRVAELLEAVGIDPASGHRFPHQFSGGQRQRISIARALAPGPGLLLADEPVSALDVSVRAQVLNLITDLVDDLGLTLVFVSHDLSVVRHVCHRVVVMKAGEIVEEGPTAQVYGEPREPYTRRLVQSVPTIQRALAGVTAADLAAARKEEHPA